MKWPHGTDTLGKATAGRLTVPPRRLTLRGLPGARRCRMLPHDGFETALCAGSCLLSHVAGRCLAQNPEL